MLLWTMTHVVFKTKRVSSRHTLSSRQKYHVSHRLSLQDECVTQSLFTQRMCHDMDVNVS